LVKNKTDLIPPFPLVQILSFQPAVSPQDIII